MENPFKLMEPIDDCPPHLKEELVAEIDIIRNAMTIVQLYVGEFFGVATVLASPPQSNNNATT